MMYTTDRVLARLAAVLIILVQLMAMWGLVGALLETPRFSWWAPYMRMAPNTAIGLLALAIALLCLLVMVTHHPCRWYKEPDDVR